MPKPFDAALKELVTTFPADWLDRLGIPITEPPEVISAELSTVTAAADTFIRVGKLVVHIDLEAGPDEDLATRMLLYNVLAHRHTGLPVRSVAVLLRSNAQRANLTDRVEYENLRFRYDVIKVWEIPSEELLLGGVGMLPLAVLGKAASGRSRGDELPMVVSEIVQQAQQDAQPLASKIVTAAFILAGMHHTPELVQLAFQGAMDMIESSTFELVQQLGYVKYSRDLLIQQGTEKFGDAPTAEQLEKLKSIHELKKFKRLLIRLIKVDSWTALLRGIKLPAAK